MLRERRRRRLRRVEKDRPEESGRGGHEEEVETTDQDGQYLIGYEMKYSSLRFSR